MAYQNVGTPRFYINDALWATSMGMPLGTSTIEASVLQMNPSRQIFRAGATQHYITAPTPSGINYVAVLGHKGLLANNCDINIGGANYEPHDVGVNIDNTWDPPPHDGWSLMTFPLNDGLMTECMLNGGAEENESFSITFGCISFGRYYDMPHSPNLSLTKSIDYGEVKEITTYNGSSISNTMASKPPMWGDMDAWEIYNDTSYAKHSRSGRRRWNLKFSYLDDGDLWGSNQGLGTYEYGSQDTAIYGGDNDLTSTATTPTNDVITNPFTFNILTDQNFFSQVWHKTLGGTLPFIFQQDKSNYNADQFAICKFVNSSLKATQSAFHVYDISVSIEEVW